MRRKLVTPEEAIIGRIRDQLTTEGLELIEVAPGIDVERDILPHMAFRPLMRAPGLMDERIFSRDLVGLEAGV